MFVRIDETMVLVGLSTGPQFSNDYDFQAQLGKRWIPMMAKRVVYLASLGCREEHFVVSTVVAAGVGRSRCAETDERSRTRLYEDVG